MTAKRVRQVALVLAVVMFLVAVAFFLVAVWSGDGQRWTLTGVITFVVAFVTAAAAWIGSDPE